MLYGVYSTDTPISTNLSTSLYKRMWNVVQQSSITHCYRRPPPWPSQKNISSFETAKKCIRAAILLLFGHIISLFPSDLCLGTIIKAASRYDVRNKVSMSFSFCKTKGFISTVIQPFKKQNVRIPSSKLLFQGSLSNLKSSMLLLFIAINFLSTSDLSSSDGGKHHFVASAISSSNGATRNSLTTLRCYVCGGKTGLPCEDIRSSGRRSPYVRPKPQTTLDGRKMFENCTDLINNKGCIKQVINGGE